MLVATFGPSTRWAGKTISYEDGQFRLEGFGPVSAKDVLKYDQQGHLVWDYEGLREWVAEQAGSAPKPSAPMIGAAVGSAARGPGQKKGGFPAWAVVLIVVVAVVAAGAVIYLPAKAGQDDRARESAVKEGIHSLQIGVQSYAVDHSDTYPDPSLMTQSGMATYLDYWPTNPYTGAPMTQGTGPGDFSYTVTPDGTSFHLTGHGREGETLISVP